MIFTACGNKSKIDIKLDGKQIPFETRSAWITSQDAIHGSNAPGEQKHALRWITIRNYEYEVESATSANEGKLTSPEQVKLFLSFHEADGTNKDTALVASTFNGANDGPLEFEFLNLTIFGGRKGRILSGFSRRTAEQTRIGSKDTFCNRRHRDR